MSSTAFDQLVELLVPIMATEADRRALVTKALGIDFPLRRSLDYTGTAFASSVNVLERLYDYGQMDDGRTALAIFLSEAKKQLGVDKQTQIDHLLREIERKRGRAVSDVPAAQPSTAHTHALSSTVVKPVHFCISYARNDGFDFANTLYDLLIDCGIRPWMDTRDIPPGADWNEHIDTALQKAQVVGVVLTPKAVQSRQVQSEWMDALNRRVPIIPMLVQDCTVPRLLRTYNWIDFRGSTVPKPDKLSNLCRQIHLLINSTTESTYTALLSPRMTSITPIVDTSDAQPYVSSTESTLPNARSSNDVSELERLVPFLRLFEAETITALRIKDRWRDSISHEKAEWCRVPIAKMNNNETREVHFWSEADGNHAMIAGSAGSGKSELLTTLILALAVRYDPTIVNFVLIDFKDGTAFEPFKDKLPHVVDVVTNLRGNAVGRMFAAINAELNRRQALNNRFDVTDIVAYRTNGWHLRPQASPYPHLFIVIDEFAEMIANNPEYRSQLDSITRLGRSLGVSLILAAQRPSGVTNQMRANIKMKICLRVETEEESSELLRMPDAAYLPSIPGRGYLQIGSESLELIQAGFSGETYSNRPDYDPRERYLDREFVWRDDLQNERDEIVSDVLIRRLHQAAKEAYGEKPTWRKPWPDPLPAVLYLNSPENLEVEHIDHGEREYAQDDMDEGAAFVLAPAINRWLTGRWTDYPAEFKWKLNAMRTVVGLLDNPSEARLHPLKIDFTKGHHVIFGAAGYGKSIFVRSVLTALIANHAPDVLHIYIMDFGNRSLQVFENAPHVGDYITGDKPQTPERVDRLLRMLDQEVEQRRRILSTSDDFITYNHAQSQNGTPENVLPALLVVIDNFAMIKENYEVHLETLTVLMREGLAVGLYFLITGEQSSAVGRLYNLIPERLTLKLSDDSEYAQIVGRGAWMVEEVPGRGFKRRDRVPLEMQVALPITLPDEAGSDEEASDTDNLTRFLLTIADGVQNNASRYDGRLPPSIRVLDKQVALNDVLSDFAQEFASQASGTGQRQHAVVVIGRNEYDLRPTQITLDQRPHFVVSGAPASGKTTVLLTWIVALASRYTCDQVAMVLVDHQGNLGDYGSSNDQYRLDQLPHMLTKHVISEKDDLEMLVRHLVYEYHQAPKLRPKERELFILIDNYDDIEQLDPAVSGISTMRRRLGYLARRYGRQAHLHFVIAGTRYGFAGDELLRSVGSGHFGLAMDTDAAEGSPFHAYVPRAYRNSILPRGRGFVVTPGSVSVTQVAIPYYDENERAEELDRWFEIVCERNEGLSAEWLELPKELAPDANTLSVDSRITATTDMSVLRLTAAQYQNLLEALASRLRLTPDQTEESVKVSFQDISGHQKLINIATGFGIDVQTVMNAPRPKPPSDTPPIESTEN